MPRPAAFFVEKELLDFSAAIGVVPVAFRTLDFWVGKWDVYDTETGKLAGTSVLQKILRGCALSVVVTRFRLLFLERGGYRVPARNFATTPGSEFL